MKKEGSYRHRCEDGIVMDVKEIRQVSVDRLVKPW
jgi:hypothetical protein